MRHWKMWFLAAVITLIAAGCGPNKFYARGTVLHPMHKFKAETDVELPRPRSIVMISRKEGRVNPMHRIAGAPRTYAQGELAEPAILPPQNTDGSGLLIEVRICSNYKDEMDLRKYDYVLILPDGRKVKGTVHRLWAIRDHTQKVTGAHRETHAIVKDGGDGKPQAYTHIEEVENDLTMYCRKVRVIFQDERLITKDTKYVTFVVTGNQRRRTYRFDFTFDPYEAIESSNRWEYYWDENSD